MDNVDVRVTGYMLADMSTEVLVQSPSQIAKDCVKINDLEKFMALECGDQIIDMPVKHGFTPGLYTREIFMPAGTLTTSKIHKTEHPYIVIQGHMLVYMADGTVQEIKAPYRGITKPGARRVIYVVTDSVWITFHPTQETDLAKIEDQLIEPHFIPKPVLKGASQLQLKAS